MKTLEIHTPNPQKALLVLDRHEAIPFDPSDSPEPEYEINVYCMDQLGKKKTLVGKAWQFVFASAHGLLYCTTYPESK